MIKNADTRYPYIDLHSDTITALNFPKENLTHSNNRMVTTESMLKGGTLVQCFSAYVPTGYYPKPFRNTIAWSRFIKIAMKKNILLRKHRRYMIPILSSADIDLCCPGKRVGLLFTIEDLGLIGNDLSHLTTAHNLGVRIASMTWNHENTLAFPNSSKRKIMEKGLKPLGFEAVEEMNRLCIVPDVSHLSDGGFMDVLKTSKKPVIATHSNSRAMTDHTRNLTDEMIRALADQGGVMGLNFCPDFLQDHVYKGKQRISTIEDMVRHVLHIREVGGSDVLAIGSDLDGITGSLEIGSPEKIPMLLDALKKAGLTESELDKMCRDNVLRVFRETGI